MVFAAINGLALSIQDDTFSVSRQDANTWGRSAALTYEGSVYRNLRQWSFELTPLTAQEADAMTGWIEGRGNLWTFQRYNPVLATTNYTKFSCEDGLTIGTGATQYTTSKWGRWAAQINSAGNSSFTIQLSSATPLWSFTAWKSNNGGAYALCCAHYDGATLRYHGGADGATVTTAFAWSVLSTSSGGWLSVRIDGEDFGGSNATSQYSYLRALPFAATSLMFAALGARTRAEPNLPYVELSGTVLGDATQYVEVKGFVEGVKLEQATKYGTFQTLHVLKVRLEER
jgi:hypothetical protein